MAYDEVKLVELTSYISRGITPSYAETEGMCVINQKCIRNGVLSLAEARLHNESKKKVPTDKIIQPMDILVNSTGTGTLGRVAQVTSNIRATVDSHVTIVRPAKEVNPLFLGYAVKWRQPYIEALAEGSTGQTELSRFRLGDEITIPLPSLAEQKQIAETLFAIDCKINTNSMINDNLLQQAFALFDDMFKGLRSSDDGKVGDHIVPRRGKTLLSKNAVDGDVPVVAGGLEPSTYHNTANTVPPVITISASGANAGFVNLWSVPVWSSDSTFIDATMTDAVYFWFVLLKRRQQEIYDAQTGSAQPHIYPQHIADLPLGELPISKIAEYQNLVSPFFATIGSNKSENARLAAIRDSLLPRLMSGAIDVSDINI